MLTFICVSAAALLALLLATIIWAIRETRPFTIAVEDITDMPNQHTRRAEHKGKHRFDEIAEPYRPRPPVVSGGPLSATERRERMIPVPVQPPAVIDDVTEMLPILAPTETTAELTAIP